MDGAAKQSPGGDEAGGSVNQKERKNERYFNETVTGSRCSFRTSDKKMEP